MVEAEVSRPMKTRMLATGPLSPIEISENVGSRLTAIRTACGKCAIAIRDSTARPQPVSSGRTFARSANAAPIRTSMVMRPEREPENQTPAIRMAMSALCMRGGNRNVTRAASASSNAKANAFGFCEKPEIW